MPSPRILDRAIHVGGVALDQDIGVIGVSLGAVGLLYLFFRYELGLMMRARLGRRQPAGRRPSGLDAGARLGLRLGARGDLRG